MQIQMLASRFGAGGALYVAGTQYDVPNALALDWIGSGVATPVGDARKQIEASGRSAIEVDQRTGVATAAGQALAGAAPLRTALFVGDSITDYARVGLTLTSVTNLGNGTAAIERTAHGMTAGQVHSIVAAADPAVNVMRATIISVADANNFTSRLDGPVHTVAGTGPSMMIEDRASTRGWPNWLETFAGEPLRRTWAAIGGGKMIDIIDLLPKLQPGFEDMAFICIGMNDIYSAGDSLAVMQARWSQLIALVRARSGRIVVLSVPPRTTAAPWDEPKQTIHNQWNRWLYEQCALNGWDFVDTWGATQGGATYVDGAANNPEPLAAMVHDSTHPSMRGAAAIGAAVWAKVQKWFGVSGWRAAHPDAIGADAGNLLSGSNFATDSAGVATNWARDISNGANMGATLTVAARTVAADGDACGKKQVMTLNYGTAAGTPSCRFRRNGIQALLTAGDRCYFAVPFRVTGAVGLIGLDVAMFGTVTGGTSWQVYGHAQDSNADPMVGDFSGWLITPISTFPANVTNLDVWVRAYLNSTQVADVVVEVWQPQLRRVA
jgi:lysophospholipase L1-like esterase